MNRKGPLDQLPQVANETKKHSHAADAVLCGHREPHRRRMPITLTCYMDFTALHLPGTRCLRPVLADETRAKLHARIFNAL